MKESAPWLSIIIPAFNAERHLEACVESIDPIAHEGVEVILVDDGSTDLTPELCNRLAGTCKRVKVIHRKNGGSSSARNEGFACAEGDFVWFVDADDLIAPGALDLIEKVAAGSNADAFQIAFVLFSDDDKPSWPSLMLPISPERYTSRQFLSGFYHERFQHFACSFLFRAGVLHDREDRISAFNGRGHGGFPFREDFSLYEDVVTMEELVRQFEQIDVLNLPVYGYRQTPTAMTHRRSNVAAKSGLRAVLEIARYEVLPEDSDAKMCMEISLLFSAYKLIEERGGAALKRVIKNEIELRANRVGILKLGVPRLIRYVLLKTKLLDFIIRMR